MSVAILWRVLRVPALVAALLVGGIGVAGFHHVHTEQRRTTLQVEAELAAVAELKVRQVEAWRADRLADVAVLAENPFLRRMLAAPDVGRTGAAVAEAEAWLAAVTTRLRYQYALVLDAHGAVAVAAGHGAEPGAANVSPHLRSALAARAPIVTELEPDEATDAHHIDLLAPVRDPERSGAALGAVLLRIDPDDFLGPLLRSWPRATASAETVLVRVDGASAVRASAGRGPGRRVSFEREALDPLADAAAGGAPFVLWLEEPAGGEVIAAGRRIPGTAWSLVVRVKADELLEPGRAQAKRLAWIVLLLMASAVGSVLLWLRHATARLERERLEEALAREVSARHHELLSEHADDAVLLVDGDGRVVRANDRVRDYYGRTPAEMIGLHVRDLRAPGYGEAFEGHLARIRGEGRLRFETVHRRSDGSTIPVEVCARGFEAEGRFFYQAVVRDQTERLETLRTLAFQAELLQNLHDAVIGLDADQVVRSWNAAAEHVFGHAAADVIGRRITDALPSEYQGLSYADVLANLERHGRIRFEVRRRHRSGAWVHIEASAVALRGADGRITGYVSVNRDVTARKHAEAALRHSQERLARILESSSEGIWIVDGAGTTEYVNERATRIFGTSHAEAVGRPLLDFVQAPSVEGAHAAVAAALAGENVRREFEVHREGAHVWINASWTPLRDGADRVTGAVGLFMDVTELRRAREQLLHSQKMDAVGRLASGVAHDFNNLLVAILSCSEHLAERLPADDPLQEEAREIRCAGTRAAQLVRQLLAFGRKSTPCPAPVDASAVVRGIEGILRRAAGRGVDVTLALEPAPWPTRIDPGQLEQVVMNLAVNARDAMPTGGRLRIETRAVTVGDTPGAHGLGPGRYVALAVADSGCGMSPEVVAHAFEPFFTTKPKGAGTGLGLATVYAIVKEAGGTIVVDSEPGRGTTLTLYLPACAAAPGAAEPARTGALAQAGAGRVVLVVDDESAVRRAARRILEHRGFRVVEASGATDALERVAQGGPVHVVLTDVVMPHVSGPELAASLGALRPGLPVLLMSGCSAGVDRGDRAILDKPFTPDGLVAYVEEGLRAAAGP